MWSSRAAMLLSMRPGEVGARCVASLRPRYAGLVHGCDLRRDRNVWIAGAIERFAYEPVALPLVHEFGDRRKPGLVAFWHRDRNADLLERSVGDARARHLFHISRQRIAR